MCWLDIPLEYVFYPGFYLVATDIKESCKSLRSQSTQLYGRRAHYICCCEIRNRNMSINGNIATSVQERARVQETMANPRSGISGNSSNLQIRRQRCLFFNKIKKKAELKIAYIRIVYYTILGFVKIYMHMERFGKKNAVP